jgi:hypothetical protein
MHTGRTQLFIAVVALASSGAATALGFGPIRSSVVLGQTLNIAVPVNLAEGETLSAECAGAEVMSGENKVAAGNVRVRVTRGRDGTNSVLRISTTSVIEEPVLTVTLSAGCPTRLSRTVVLLADPPLVRTASAPAESQALPTVAPPTSEPLAAAPSPPPEASAAPRAARRAPPSRSNRIARAEPPTRAAVAVAAPAAPTQAREAAPPLRRMGQRSEAKPRLQLDAGQVALGEAAVQAAQEQASAARATAMAAEAAASAAGERMLAMEAEIARMRTEAKAQTDALLQLRQQMALDRAQREQPSPLMLALIGLAALLAALAAWLGWRLRSQMQVVRSQADWWERGPNSQVASVMPPAPSDFVPSQQSARERVSTSSGAWSDSVESRHGPTDSQISPLTMPAPTMVTIPSLASTAPAIAAEDESSRAMSVDEQIDLEQQADFFIALGHDDAAIDLLMAHMRSTGGGSPLPFLKLLEIHRRRDQRDAYERTRIRFNQRFNSVAPDWQADPKAGRSLIDYPLAMGRIQRAWPSPLDAMAELEALLFRRGASAELFDLPAYQEVLFLYQMARDLHDAENVGAADVDVLLPIGGRSAPVPAAEGTIVLRPEFNDGEPVSLDLDLTPEHADQVDTIPVEPADEPTSNKKTDSGAAAEPESDFWGSNPDARPTR